MTLPTGVFVIANRLGEAQRIAGIAEAALIEIREEAVKDSPDVKRIAELANRTLGQMTP